MQRSRATMPIVLANTVPAEQYWRVAIRTIWKGRHPLLSLVLPETCLNVLEQATTRESQSLKSVNSTRDLGIGIPFFTFWPVHCVQ